jgi:predicted Zn-dependent protease
VTVRHALVVTMLAVATACSRGPGGRLHATAPGDDDLALASRAVGEYRRRVRPSSDAAAVARLARVSGALVDAAKAGTARDRAAALPWDIVLVESPNSNVATFTNGTIFVDAGLLRLVPTDDALAGALGQAIVRPLLHEGGGRGGRIRGGDMLDFGGGASRVDRATRESEEADYEGLVLAVDAGYDPELAVGAFDQLGLRERAEAAREHLPALKERHAQR